MSLLGFGRGMNIRLYNFLNCMHFWDTIINTAMMGTDKKQIGVAELPGGLAGAAALVNENIEKGKEEKFLQLASLAFNYRQCGELPVQKEVILPVAPPEEKEYCNATATRALNDIISEASVPLLNFWLRHCYEKQQIIQPETVPVLLALGAQHKQLQLLIAACCGKRGEWLGSFNPAWNFSTTQPAEELWQTGTFDQRKEILRQLRKTDPSKARIWVQQTWAQEDANTKTGLLELLAENANNDDIPFLESLSADKSKKVKEEAVKLLKQIPGSAIIRQYQEILRQAVNVKKEKALLGMTSKTVLQFHLPADIPETIFKSGIEKLSGQKNISDETFILYQLIGYTPPPFWEEHLDCSASEVVMLFKKSEDGRQLLPAIGLAAGRFKITEWATYFIDENSFYGDLVFLLPKKERERYLLKFLGIDSTAATVIQLIVQEKEEWGIELAKTLFRYIAKNPYQYNRSFFNQHIHLIPVLVVTELEKCTPAEENLRTMWMNTSQYISKLVALKIQTIKAFNA
ncbi:MAG: DUF5691 domain-containing protein [Bacteroidota bacterium]|nr:DUF5691 domain-containing protein [Bacteroidota bacterium]